MFTFALVKFPFFLFIVFVLRGRNVMKLSIGMKIFMLVIADYMSDGK